ncbi:glycerophosphodiester phosphodiesterase [Lactococcus nasutitermitis]|uniref:Glycerophosphodiester phosphodiesterase n=1 Tax=Lactococcus nasutitermitis TaxID=1652957 RepID=A0ABV9JE65_9LACT|nr:glycerophosphodiester phosphodiesterase [Lactococcus nasutitermitis]
MNPLQKIAHKIDKKVAKHKAKKVKSWLNTHQPAQHEAQTAIFAHRGSKSNRPENTLASFQEAIRVQSDGIELDVHLSADNQLIVIHDEKVDRTTNAKGLVRKLTLADIKKLDAGSWFSPGFANEKIPTLNEVLTLLTEQNFTGSLNIEIKTDKYHYPDIEKLLSHQMTSQNWQFSYLYSSFNLSSLAIIHKLEQTTELAYLTYNHKKDVILGNKQDFITSIHPKKTYAFDNPNQTMSNPKPIRLWTINNSLEMQIAYQENVEAIITDHPEKALQLRDKFNKPHS